MAGGRVRTVSVRVTAEITDLEKKLKSVQKTLKNTGKKFKNVGTGLTKSVTAPLLAAGAGIFALVTKTADAGDEIQKMGKRTGFSTEALSELSHAADLSGSSIGSVEKGVKRMQKMLFDAEKGLSTSKDALAALNLSYEDLQNLSPEEQFSKLSDAIADIEDPSRRAALAQEVFGKAGTELLPMFAEGSEGLANMRQEAHDLGLVFDQDAADASAKFNDDLDRLKKGFGGVFKEMSMNLMPMLTDKLLPAIRDNVIPMMKRLAERIQSVFEWFSDLSPGMQKVVLIGVALAAALGPVLVVVGMLITAIGALMSPIGLVILGIAALIAITVLVIKNWDTIKEFFINLWEKVKDIFWDSVEYLKQLFLDYHPIGLIFKHWDKITKYFSDLWDGVKKIFSDTWDSIVDVMRGPINMILGFANTIIGAYEKMLNSVAKVINAIPSISIPEWVPVFGGNSFGIPNIPTISLPKIPMLETGTNFVPKDMLAMLHEGEAIVPKEFNPSAGGGQTIHTTINIDGRKVAQATSRPQNDLLDRRKFGQGVPT